MLIENIIKEIERTCLSEGVKIPLLISRVPIGDYHGRQEPADKLIEEIFPLIRDFPALLLTEVDIHYLSLGYVFGFTDLLREISVVSLARLRRGAPTYRLIERAVKTAIHEIGHLNGLRHCKNKKCVMTLSFSLADTDRKDKMFCDKCLNILNRFLHELPITNHEKLVIGGLDETRYSC